MDTNENRINREEIINAVNSLVRLCEKQGMAVSGFVWGVKTPMLLSFGNVKEQHDLPALSEVYLTLCGMVEESLVDGTNVETRHIDRVQ